MPDVMPGLDPGIHVVPPNYLFPMTFMRKHVDGRVEPGHDEFGDCQITLNSNF